MAIHRRLAAVLLRRLSLLSLALWWTALSGNCVANAVKDYEVQNGNAIAQVWEHYGAGTTQSYYGTGNNLNFGSLNDRVTTVWAQEGYRVRIWQHGGRTGAVITVHSGYHDLYSELRYLNDQMSSIDVATEAPCTLYEHDRGIG